LEERQRAPSRGSEAEPLEQNYFDKYFLQISEQGLSTPDKEVGRV